MKYFILLFFLSQEIFYSLKAQGSYKSEYYTNDQIKNILLNEDMIKYKQKYPDILSDEMILGLSNMPIKFADERIKVLKKNLLLKAEIEQFKIEAKSIKSLVDYFKTIEKYPTLLESRNSRLDKGLSYYDFKTNALANSNKYIVLVDQVNPSFPEIIEKSDIESIRYFKKKFNILE